MNWNPLYPSNEDVDPLEEAAREAEWMDDMRRFDQELQERNGISPEDDEISQLFG